MPTLYFSHPPSRFHKPSLGASTLESFLQVNLCAYTTPTTSLGDSPSTNRMLLHLGILGTRCSTDLLEQEGAWYLLRADGAGAVALMEDRE